MSVRFSGTVGGHEVVLDSDESLVVIDRLRLFVGGELVDERKSLGGKMSMHANVGGTVFDVQIRSGAVVGSVKAVTVTVDGGEPVDLVNERP